ncbi:unnamed protein product [Rotaria sordida]|uniref:Uncharacterized protein n=1 Tax=Rotaria sordida TaxID=392033 RepID=A0A819JXA4_9BILA|nr:unnamed protein product [Rotaria sordida]CAF4124514.1 unnamed protein product [Rotaria sordida]
MNELKRNWTLQVLASAAAHNKLGNNDQVLSDCFRSIEIDPNYSKVYGRLDVIYLSLNKVHEALDAYKKAHTLNPNNEHYKQSIQHCEDQLNGTATGTNQTNGPNLSSMFGTLLGDASSGPNMMSFFNNPALMNMFLLMVNTIYTKSTIKNLIGQEGGQVDLETLLQEGQRIANELSTNNPNLVESLRRNMSNRSQLNTNNNSTSNSNNESDQNRPSSS